MLHSTNICPRCGSSHTASRRQLFHWLMGETRLDSGFGWYNEDLPRARPPRSQFVLALLFVAALAVPALGFTLLGNYVAVTWLAALVALGLLFDLFLIYPQYRDWGGEWLCSECRSVFRQQPLI